MKRILIIILFTIPSLTLAIDLESFYITAKDGVSKSMDTGVTNFVAAVAAGGIPTRTMQNNDLGTGTTFGFILGEYLTDNFRLELEATKRTGYEYDASQTNQNLQISYKAKNQTETLFINGFYDFQAFTVRNTPITPYLGMVGESQEMKWGHLWNMIMEFPMARL